MPSFILIQWEESWGGALLPFWRVEDFVIDINVYLLPFSSYSELIVENR